MNSDNGNKNIDYSKNNGQPYYDENGILRNVPDYGHSNENAHKSDPYEQMYRNQLDEFERMSGEQDFDDTDLTFHPMDEAYKKKQQSSRSSSNGNVQNHSRNKTAGNNNHQKNVSKKKSNNQKSNNSSAKSKKRKPDSTSEKKGVKSKKVTEKKKHPIRTFFKILLILIIILFIVLNIILWNYIGMVKVKSKGTRTYTNGSINESYVRNILLIGSDTRDTNQNGRTDTMILLSVNKKSKEITMTSIMRDTYVEIKGKDTNGENIDTYGKINSAYVYGGAELLMDTIEQNFDVSVDDYVYVDFTAFIDIVNSVGGIKMNITDEEAVGMQPQTMEVNDILGRRHDADILNQGGNINLNGYQALAYARLRYVGNADFQRTERQRTVIQKVIEKVKSNPTKFNSFAKATAKNLTTNMSKTEMHILCYKMLFSLNYDIKSLRLPADGDYTYGNHNGQSTLDVDFDKCRELIRNEIYKE